MSLQLVLGHSGTGKTTYIYEQLSQRGDNLFYCDSQNSDILIVPEQSTLITQQDLIQKFKNNSIMAVEILSFQRLAFRMSDYLGIAGKVLLDENAQQMLIRKLILENQEGMRLLKRNSSKKGYTHELKQLLTEFMRYNITSEQLESVSTQLKKSNKGGLLSTKLDEMNILFKGYKVELEKQFTTQEAILGLLKNKIHTLDQIKNAHIYIDGFYGFTPIQYDLIRELLATAKKVTISITIDRSSYESKQLSETELFFDAKSNIEQLLSICRDEHVEVLEPITFFHEKAKRFTRPALLHLQEHFYRYPIQTYQGATAGLSICQSSSIAREISYVVDTIWYLIREKNYRFSDISLLCGQIDTYERLLSEAFYEADIPLYVDVKKSLVRNPFIQWVLGLLNMASTGYSTENVIGLLKTDLMDYDVNTIDILENYAIAYGLKSQKKWLEVFKRPIPMLNLSLEHPYQVFQLENLNREKMLILEPIVKIITELKKELTTIERIRSLVDYFEVNQFEQKLEKMADEFHAQGEFVLEREYRQIYGMLIALFDQMAQLIGTEITTPKDFKLLLEAGLDNLKVGAVPAAIDQVVVGDVNRSRLKQTKALFVLGVNEGAMPRAQEKASFISDRERELLETLELKLAPTAKKQIFKEQFNIFMGFLQVRERLYISYSKSSKDGSSLRPSVIVHMLKKMFSEIKIVDIDKELEKQLIVNRPMLTFKKLIDTIKRHETDERYQQAYIWFNRSEVFAPIIEKSMEALTHTYEEEALEEELVSALYGETFTNSVTRLETFSKCPFRHFLDYGLHLQERKTYEVGPPELGIVFHKAIEIFTSRVAHENMEWHDMTDDLRITWVSEIIDELMNLEEQQVFLSSARNRYMVEKLKRMTNRAIWAITYQICKGSFRPDSAEWQFKGDEEHVRALTLDLNHQVKMHLTGTIDRVDAFNMGENTYLTIIDYKSGQTQFDIVGMYYGLQLQLFIYLNAATELKSKTVKKTVIPAGVFYFHIDDPIILVDSYEAEAAVDSEILLKMRLNGLVLDDEEVIKQLDKEIVGKSDVIPVTLKNDGHADARSQVVSEEGFNILQTHVQETAREIGNKILLGNIEVKPYKRGKETACEYCSYQSICQFESESPSALYRELNSLDKDTILERMKETWQK